MLAELSKEIDRVLRDDLPIEQASPEVQQWAKLTCYNIAANIVKLKDKQSRIDAFNSIADSQLKKGVKELANQLF